MSLLKTLQLGDNAVGRYTKEYLLTDYYCHTKRDADEYRPKTEKLCDYIEMSVVAPGKDDMQLYDWFIKQTTISGRILVQLPPRPFTSETDVNEVQFDEAKCFSFEEEYHINSSQRRTLRMRFIAKEVKINGVSFYHL